MRRVGAALVAAALAGCADCNGERAEVMPVDAGPPQLAETEPNDSPQQANPLSGSTIVAASLSADPSRPDEDWYEVTSPIPQQVDLALSGIAGTDVTISVFDQDRNPVLTVNSEGEGKGERFPNLSLSHKLFVRVSSGKKGSGGAYTLTVLFSEPVSGFEREPNDRSADANPLSLGDPAQGFLAHAADQDWYVVSLPALTARAAAPPGASPGGGQTTNAPSIAGAPSDRAGETGPDAGPSAATDVAQPEPPSAA